MYKRLIALIGALAMVLTLAVPCFAVTEILCPVCETNLYDDFVENADLGYGPLCVNCEYEFGLCSVCNYTFVYEGECLYCAAVAAEEPEPTFDTTVDYIFPTASFPFGKGYEPIIYISSAVKVSGVFTTDGSTFSYIVPDLVVFTNNSGGYIYAYFNYVTEDGFKPTRLFYSYCSYDVSYTYASSTNEAISNNEKMCSSLSFSYNLSDVVSYNAELCDMLGFVYPFSSSITEEDLTNARQEGYNEGYQAGVGSTDAYQEGFDAGVGSVDTDAYYQNGYTDGEAAGIETGYQNGYEEGYDEGYDQGRSETLESLDDLTYGLFSTAKFTAIVTGSNPSSGASYTKNIEFTPNFIYSGVFFTGLYDQIDAYLGSTFGDNATGWEYVDRVEIQMEWDNENVFDYQILSLYISGDMDVNYGQITTTSGKSYAINAVSGTSGDRREFIVDTTSSDPIVVSKVVIRVGRPADLLTAFTLYSPDESYNEGYTEGYGVGFIEGKDVGWVKGVDDGYDLGFDEGKAEGLKISETGDWRNLMLAVVGTPVNTIQSLFNFEILGLDMRLAFGSILALCVVLIIIKKVLL